MIRAELPIPRALNALQALSGPRTDSEDALMLLLVWMAAARMIQAGNVLGVSRIDDLATQEAWVLIEQAGLPLPQSRGWLSREANEDGSFLQKAKQIIKEMVNELGRQPWDVLPTLTTVAMNTRYGTSGVLSSEVSELMLDMLGESKGTLWIPFDHWGVLVIRALRRGWSVKSASMFSYAESALSLLLAIEYGRPNTELLDSEIERDRDGWPTTEADCILANPPFGITVQDSKLAQWDSSRGKSWGSYTRAETWALHELAGRASRKVVFLVPHSVLFSRGQEERLREELLDFNNEINKLHSVIGLPGGAISATNIATALITVTPNQNNSSVRMVDLGMSLRSMTDIDKTIRIDRDIIMGQAEDEARACRVTREDIRAAEYSFVPSRYLGKRVEVGANAQPLEAVCELIRPPVIARDDNGKEYLEVGVSDLKVWNEVGSKLEKRVQVQVRREVPTLKSGDLVLSIKGTVGKVGLMVPQEHDSVVVSQICLGLRIRPNGSEQVSPQYLLMYLRSAAGQAQLQYLQTGAATQHISPQTLLSSFLVPIPQAHERAEVEEEYQRLCELEHQVTKIQKQMQEISELRWTV